MSGVDFDALRNMDAFVEHLSQNHSETANAILASHAPDATLRQAAAAVAVSPERAMEEGSDSEALDAAPVSGEETEVERLRRELEQAKVSQRAAEQRSADDRAQREAAQKAAADERAWRETAEREKAEALARAEAAEAEVAETRAERDEAALEPSTPTSATSAAAVKQNTPVNPISGKRQSVRTPEDKGGATGSIEERLIDAVESGFINDVDVQALGQGVPKIDEDVMRTAVAMMRDESDGFAVAVDHLYGWMERKVDALKSQAESQAGRKRRQLNARRKG